MISSFAVMIKGELHRDWRTQYRVICRESSQLLPKFIIFLKDHEVTIAKSNLVPKLSYCIRCPQALNREWRDISTERHQSFLNIRNKLENFKVSM